jgi:hypothetical protein
MGGGGVTSQCHKGYSTEKEKNKDKNKQKGDQDAVFRLEDINHNGDAQDDGESSIWFSAAGNDAGLTLPTPNGVWETNDGDVVVYIVNAGTSSQPNDYVLRTQDLDGDGNANGP